MGCVQVERSHIRMTGNPSSKIVNVTQTGRGRQSAGTGMGVLPGPCFPSTHHSRDPEREEEGRGLAGVNGAESRGGGEDPAPLAHSSAQGKPFCFLPLGE